MIDMEKIKRVDPIKAIRLQIYVECKDIACTAVCMADRTDFSSYTEIQIDATDIEVCAVKIKELAAELKRLEGGTMIDLTKFCKPNHKHFGKPWSINNYTYATDGAILIRIPRDGDDDAQDKSRHPNAAAVLDEAKSIQRHEWVTPPQPEAKQESCSMCDGEGCAYLCKECRGADHDCPECDGDGVLTKTMWGMLFGSANPNLRRSTLGTADKIPDKYKIQCPECCGAGTEMVFDNVNIDGSVYGGKYITLINQLPGIQFSAPHNETQPALFKFDGGDGALMPIRM